MDIPSLIISFRVYCLGSSLYVWVFSIVDISRLFVMYLIVYRIESVDIRKQT